MGAMLGASAGAAGPLAASLGTSTAMPTIAMPASVMPLSQQIAGMAQPALTAPTLGGEQKLPSLGVDLSMPSGSQGPGLLEQLGSGLAGAGQSFGAVKKALQPQSQPMQMMQLSQGRQPVQLQGTDLLSLLRGMGGY